MANGSFGVEHPLVTVRDITAVSERYQAIGFDPTPLGRHPWGTVNRLVMFPDNFIELIAIADDAAIDADPIGGALFGRRVRDRLALGEGISLLALRSNDADWDAKIAAARGATSVGRVDFRRPVRLPNGRSDEAVVTLEILADDAMPGLSVFLCQQHKPHLVWNADWLRHRNGSDAITAVTYFARNPLDVARRVAAIWGDPAVVRQPGGLRVETAGGVVHIYDAEAVETRFPGMAISQKMFTRAPCGVAISVHTATFDVARALARTASGVVVEDRRVLIPAEFTGGTILEIHA